MPARVAAVFRSLCEELNVDNHDFSTLEAEGIRTADELYFRLPTAEKWESFLSDVAFPILTSVYNDGNFVRVDREADGGGPPDQAYGFAGPQQPR